MDDLPYYNWNKAVKGEFYYLCKWYNFDNQYLKHHFEGLMCQFIDMVGISHDYRKYLQDIIELVCLETDFAMTGDRYYLTFIQLKKLEIEAYEKKEEKKSIDLKVYVNKFLGFQLNDKKTSVRDFYSYLQMMEEEIKAQNVQHGKD